MPRARGDGRRPSRLSTCWSRSVHRASSRGRCRAWPASTWATRCPRSAWSTPAAPSRWPTPSACTTWPATRATPSRASSTSAASGGTPGSGRLSPSPSTTGCPIRPDAPTRTCRACSWTPCATRRRSASTARASPTATTTTWPPAVSASPAGRPACSCTPAGLTAVEEISEGPLSGDRSSPINRVTFLVPLGLARARRGLDGVWEALDEAAASTERLGEPSYATMARAATAEARWLAGDDENARAELALAAAWAAQCPSERKGVALQRWRITGEVGPEADDLPAPYAAELKGDVHEAVRLWDEVGRSVRRRHGAARLVRRAGPPRGARAVRRPRRGPRSRDGPQEAPRPRRPGRPGRRRDPPPASTPGG